MLPEHSHRVRHALVILAACVTGACTDPSSPSGTIFVEDQYGAKVEWAGDPALAKALAALRDTTDELHDVNVALARGYRPSAAGCESHGDEGAMGIHYGHPALLGVVPRSSPTTGTDPVINPLRPEVIIYEPQADGSLALVAVENLVFKAAWEQAGNSKPPSYQGVPYDTMMDDPATAIDEAWWKMPAWRSLARSTACCVPLTLRSAFCTSSAVMS